MIRPDPNMAMVELIAQALGPLREQLVFVGGCAAGLLLTDPAAGLTRVTYDVDLLAEVTALPGYHRLESEFSRLGFKRDMAKDAPVCRWRFGEVEVDLMPTEDSVLGFANRWYPLVARTRSTRVLPSGMTIRLISAPDDLRGYLADRCGALLAQSAFHDALPGLIFPDESHASRMKILIERLRRITTHEI